jgi:hypothetical protein
MAGPLVEGGALAGGADKAGFDAAAITQATTHR